MPYDHLIELLDFVERARKSALPEKQPTTRKGRKTAYRQPTAPRTRKSRAKTKASKRGANER